MSRTPIRERCPVVPPPPWGLQYPLARGTATAATVTQPGNVRAKTGHVVPALLLAPRPRYGPTHQGCGVVGGRTPIFRLRAGCSPIELQPRGGPVCYYAKRKAPCTGLWCLR